MAIFTLSQYKLKQKKVSRVAQWSLKPFLYKELVPIRGIEPRVDPYHGSVLPLYYIGMLLF